MEIPTTSNPHPFARRDQEHTKNEASMKNTRIGLLAAAALWLLPQTAFAQEAGEAAAEGGGEKADAAPKEGGEGEGGGEFDESEFDESEFEKGGEGGGADVGDICKIDPAACPTFDMKAESEKDMDEKILAVQQRFIIKKRRFEIMPFWGVTLNDQFVKHPGAGLGINYYITEVMAVGVNGQYFGGIPNFDFNVDSAFNAQVRRAARVGVPLTEYAWSAAANFTYVPANGKFAGFQNFIFHYDAYVVGGIGVLSTKPIPVIDPDFRNFEYKPKPAFNAGIGLKIFLNRWFAAVLEVRDYIFLDELENLEIGETNDARADEASWEGKSTLTNNVQAQLGVSVFIPFSFEYRLPKAGADTTGPTAAAGAK
jgi:outer membrane beta-barrel protein